ncbi:Glycoprotein-N-acetylgalactosamine 3-beta-galactosyltransferase 1-B [Pseudocercospora fuligena]|uniref:N-acetylgalactosaminide beta-1,3-galactosyltransferase n=1 Tax=Pseudocercospora fuligena TaxID=685502 RepID=A0A8H6RMJ9_9PEZI|nr:Glycoprotein-N-acetylgalactosamine 3-beta-galactosyltransferase 1-B [Pseudocercospora fuligena]
MEQRFFSRKVSLGWVFCLVAATVLATVLYLGNWSQRRDAWRIGGQGPIEEQAVHLQHDPECVHMPGADEVLVILKTGATEAYEKLPIHLVTTLKCISNYIVVSDLETKVADTPVYDALREVTMESHDQFEDFDFYRDIQRWNQEGQDVREFPSDAAWNLDKWKFLPMLHHAFESASDSTKWFVFIEADTSLSWLNLLHWLERQDPHKASYFGGPAPYIPVPGFFFAHGGTGIVISRPALEHLEHARAREEGGPEAYDRRWEVATNETCCGDVIVGQALEEVGVEVTSVRPMFNGENPRTMVWDSENWCVPAITWHHVNAMEVDRLWQFEIDWIKENGVARPYFFHDVFEEMIEPFVSVNQSFWNNMSPKSRGTGFVAHSPDFDQLEPYEQEATRSKEGCASLCKRKPRKECVQWKWTEGKCQLARTFVFGTSDELEDQHWESGWLLDRFRSELKPCR